MALDQDKLFSYWREALRQAGTPVDRTSDFSNWLLQQGNAAIGAYLGQKAIENPKILRSGTDADKRTDAINFFKKYLSEMQSGRRINQINKNALANLSAMMDLSEEDALQVRLWEGGPLKYTDKDKQWWFLPWGPDFEADDAIKDIRDFIRPTGSKYVQALLEPTYGSYGNILDNEIFRDEIDYQDLLGNEQSPFRWLSLLSFLLADRGLHPFYGHLSQFDPNYRPTVGAQFRQIVRNIWG